MDKGDRKLHASKVHKEEKSFLNRRNELFRRLPKVDRIMGMELTKELTEQYGYRAVLEAARKVEEQLRDAMRQQILVEEKPAVFLDTSGLSGQKDGLPVKLSDLKALPETTLDYTEYVLQEMKRLLAHRSQRQMQRVINATAQQSTIQEIQFEGTDILMNLQRKLQSLHPADFIYQSCIYEPLDCQLIILGSERTLHQQAARESGS